MNGAKWFSWRGDDRRESPRFEVVLSIRNASGEPVSCDGKLGIGGCYCLMDDPPAVGETVQLKFVLLGGRTSVEARGRVKRLEPNGTRMGVVVILEGLPFETERTIARWIDALSMDTGLVQAVA
jgi:hypothetical protein